MLHPFRAHHKDITYLLCLQAAKDTLTGEKVKPKDADMDKVRSTLKQFMREWSEEVGGSPL